jgi:hypothetical protein
MRSIHRIFQEVSQIQSELWLKLPTSSGFLSRRVAQIEQFQHRLERLQERVLWLTRNQRSCLLHQDAVLLDLIALLIADAKSFRLLAEEFSIDPEGSASCLHSILQTSLPQRLRLLHQIVPPRTPSNLKSNSLQSRCVKTAC